MLRLVAKRLLPLYIALTMALLGIAAGMALAQGAPQEYQVKAAFLYKFASFVEWPGDAFSQTGGAFVIAVVGDDPFGSNLERTVDGKDVDRRKIVIRRFKRAGDIQACHILFVSRSEAGRLPQVLGRLGKASTLTVSDTGQFLQRGGMINFIIDEKKVKFDINPDAAERANLKISSKLLSVANKVMKSGSH
jgi:hypothetical protein